jgi:hypothetical protein
MDASNVVKHLPFRRVFQAGVPDENGRLLGGTEVLHLVPHHGRLFSPLSYKLNAYLPGDPPTSTQIAVLDRRTHGGRCLVTARIELLTIDTLERGVIESGDRFGI